MKLLISPGIQAPGSPGVTHIEVSTYWTDGQVTFTLLQQVLARVKVNWEQSVGAT